MELPAIDVSALGYVVGTQGVCKAVEITSASAEQHNTATSHYDYDDYTPY